MNKIIMLIRFYFLRRLGLSAGTIEGELFADTIIENCNDEEVAKRILDYLTKR